MKLVYMLAPDSCPDCSGFGHQPGDEAVLCACLAGRMRRELAVGRDLEALHLELTGRTRGEEFATWDRRVGWQATAALARAGDEQARERIGALMRGEAAR